MFKKEKVNLNTTDTLIGEGSIFEGRIKSSASIRIEGQITGDVECAGDVTIGEKGVVKSNISARNVTLAGSVQGNITAKEKLTITSTGNLNGNTLASSFIVEDGGIFTGTSKMEQKLDKKNKQETEKQNGSNQDNYQGSVASL